MQLSPLLLVKQKFPDRSLKDIPGEVTRQLSRAGFGSALRPGSRIAIGVGSRGIRNIDLIVHSAVAFWKDRGMQPFLFPAMGSHGAATAEGQKSVLEHLGVTEAAMGCPVVSQLETVSLGRTAEGIEAFMDRSAFESDGVMLIGRVKWHTDFQGKLESGLFKMMAIGLSKFSGAQRYHTYAYKLGLGNVIRTVGRQVLASGKILGGLAILEDANHHTAQLTAVPVSEMEAREEELLDLVKSWMGRIPCPLDILILDEIGKTFSGAGMDTKVVNRGVNAEYNPWTTAPRIDRIYVRGLSPHSYGNAVGIGMADVVHDRLLNAVDWTPTRINSLTASTLACLRTPMHFPTDLQCLQHTWTTVGKFNSGEVTVGWIRNSLEIGSLAITSNLRQTLEQMENVEIVGEMEWRIDSEGQLPECLPSF